MPRGVQIITKSLCMNVILFDNLCLYTYCICPALHYVAVLDVDPR